MKIAIIGTGISGLGAAYLLHRQHQITVYERNTTIGGHSRTIDVPAHRDHRIPVDTGFIVFNHRNYPELTAMFEHLGIVTEKSDMSFGASIGSGLIEYGSKGFFAQYRNLLRPQFWFMAADILRFNRQALHYLDDDQGMSLGDLLNHLKMGDWFRRYYLQAMGAAIWSCSVETILRFPAATFLRFFHNHGLLTTRHHPQWYTVTGGSREYVAKLSAPFRDHIRTDAQVVRVTRMKNSVEVLDHKGNTETYDQVVLAGHADDTLAMISNPNDAERRILSTFTFQHNDIVVHRDASFMPRTRGCWASWVYLSECMDDHGASVSLTYWMNNLQNLVTPEPVFVTLNPGRQPREDLVYDRHRFKHPVFTHAAITAQKEIGAIQGTDRLWFCGAWQKYGFHEDGLASAVRVAEQMGVTAPWH